MTRLLILKGDHTDTALSRVESSCKRITQEHSLYHINPVNAWSMKLEVAIRCRTHPVRFIDVGFNYNLSHWKFVHFHIYEPSVGKT